MKGPVRLFNDLGKEVGKIDDLLLEKILEANAFTTDLQLNNDILQELVNDYANLERLNYKLLEELKTKNRTIIEDLSSAGEIQKSLLPDQQIDLPGYEVSWECIQCDQIGGDLVNIFPYDDENWIFYILDVSGHGPKAAMITVALSQFLSPYGAGSQNREFLSPSAIFSELEIEFPFVRFNSFFTIVYGVLNQKTGKCRICNSAHPYPILVDNDGAHCIEESNPMIGMELTTEWLETEIDLAVGKGIFFYTDGVFECRNNDGEAFGEARLLEAFSDLFQNKRSGILKGLRNKVADFCSDRPFADDYSLLLISR